MNTLISFAEKHLRPFRVQQNKILPVFCPFCLGGENGDASTFVLNIETGGYKCLRGSCGVHGNISQLAEHFGEHIDFETRSFALGEEKRYKAPTQNLLNRTEQIVEYFNERGISESTLEAFNVSSDEKGNIVFPFYDENGTYTFNKYREPFPYDRKSGRQKEWRESGTKPILYGMNLCNVDEPLTITEGMIDALSLYESGIRNVVSVPSGCEDMNWIDLCWDWLDKFEKIIFFGDHDVPGKEMIETVSRRLDESRCWVIPEYPKNEDGNEYKDANEILVHEGELSVLKCWKSAEAIPIRGIIRLGSVKRIDYTQVSRIKFGIPKLDELTGGLFDGCVTIMTGSSGAGKSTLNGTILLNAIESGYKCFAYSGELPKEKFLDWILLQAAGSPWITLKYDSYRGVDVPYVPDNVAERIQSWFYDSFFLADNNELTGEDMADDIIHMCEQAARRYGCKLFLIDNAMTVVGGSDEERTAQIRLITRIKRFVTKYKTHCILVCHPRKIQSGKQIAMDDVAGAKEFSNLADTLMVMEKPDIRLLKNRDTGMNVVIKCCYCPDSRRIYQDGVGDIYDYSWSKEDLSQLKVIAADTPGYEIQVAQREIQMF